MTQNTSKILIYVPLSPVTPKIYGRSLQSTFRLEWPGKIEMVFGRNDNPTGHKYEDLVTKHNEARKMALDGGYDALFLIENDMILPPDALIKLDQVDADVAYGLYCGRHGWHHWLAFSHIIGWGGVSVSQDEALMHRVWGNVFETMGVGMGCTLIRRHVLETLPFKSHPDNAVADDWMFSLDCMNVGFKQAHHFGVHCGHIKPDGTTLWPDLHSEGGYKVEFPDETQLRFIDSQNPFVVHVGMETKIIHGYNQEVHGPETPG